MTTTTLPIHISENALLELKKLFLQEKTNVKALRIGVKGGGCSGLTYIMEFEKPKENDQKYDFDGLPVVIDKAHELYLHGTTLNYESGLSNRGFVFENPNASESCGCGTSFSI